MEAKLSENLSEVELLQKQLLNYETLLQSNRKVNQENLVLQLERKEIEMKLNE
jgi:hypothetical protein